MSQRWSHKVVEIPVKVFGGSQLVRMQAELDKWGAQGWELVSAVQAGPYHAIQLFLKKAV